MHGVLHLLAQVQHAVGFLSGIQADLRLQPLIRLSFYPLRRLNVLLTSTVMAPAYRAVLA